MTIPDDRRNFLRFGGMALAAAGAVTLMDPHQAAAQANSQSLLRTVLGRGHPIVGTGSTNPPWHFEDDNGKLTGMDIAMAKILAKGLFDDETKVDFVQQDPAARIPNIATGKVDIVIQFMTVTAGRAQQVAFSRPTISKAAACSPRPTGSTKPKNNFSMPAIRSSARSCRTCMPSNSCTRRCRRRRCCNSTPPRTRCKPWWPAARMRWSSFGGAAESLKLSAASRMGYRNTPSVGSSRR